MSTRETVSWGVVLAIVGLFGGWVTSGCATYASVEHRITAVEKGEEQHADEFKQLRQDLGEIRGDVKRLLERR